MEVKQNKWHMSFTNHGAAEVIVNDDGLHFLGFQDICGEEPHICMFPYYFSSNGLTKKKKRVPKCLKMV